MNRLRTLFEWPEWVQGTLWPWVKARTPGALHPILLAVFAPFFMLLMLAQLLAVIAAFAAVLQLILAFSWIVLLPIAIAAAILVPIGGTFWQAIHERSLSPIAAGLERIQTGVTKWVANNWSELKWIAAFVVYVFIARKVESSTPTFESSTVLVLAPIVASVFYGLGKMAGEEKGKEAGEEAGREAMKRSRELIDEILSEHQKLQAEHQKVVAELERK